MPAKTANKNKPKIYKQQLARGNGKRQPQKQKHSTCERRYQKGGVAWEGGCRIEVQ